MVHPYAVTQIIDWLDQAILLVHTSKEQFERLENSSAIRASEVLTNTSDSGRNRMPTYDDIDYAEARAKKMQKAERRAIRGAKAEEKIGSILESLGDDYQVIHDIVSPYGNIDHLVITRQNNLFLIETKAHGGRVSVVAGRLLVNGREPKKDFIAQALKNTYWLRDEIGQVINAEIWITPILVFTNAFVKRAAPVKGVMIINKKYLVNILQRPNTKAPGMPVWENRQNILKALNALPAENK